MNQFLLYDLWKYSYQDFYNQNIFFDEIFFDTRNIIKGEHGVYFCFEKIYEKAKIYVQEAVEKKVVAIVSCFNFDTKNIPILVNKNPIKLLQKFSKYHLQKFLHLQKIAITGSYGKTIIKEWLHFCLRDEFMVVSSPKSYNSQIGVPISILQTKKHHQVGIFECGISSPNEMKNLQNIICPEIGILTNIQKEHLQFFESKQQLIQEKCLLFKNSKKLFFLSENKQLITYLKSNFKNMILVQIGVSKYCDIQLINQKNNFIKVRFFSNISCFKIPMSDSVSVFNILIVIGLLYNFGFSIEKIQKKIMNLTPVLMRIELKHGVFNSSILYDTSNPDLSSIKIALERLFHFSNIKKLVVITDVFQFEYTEFNLYKKIFYFLNSMNLYHVFLIGKSIKKYQYLCKNPNSVFESYKDLIKNFNSKNITNSAILIKGSKIFKLEKFVRSIESQSHDTILEVNLDSILYNIKVFKNYLHPSTKIMAMVKANSYGTGSYEIAKFLQHHKIDYLGVAYVHEAVILRNNGIYLPIMVMNPDQNSHNTIIEYCLEPEIYSLRVLNLFVNKLQEIKYQKKFLIHIKIDSGMHRLGFQDNQIKELNKVLKKHSNLYIKSIFTHLADSDNKNSNFTFNQIKKFEKLYNKIVINLDYKPLKHILNSNGIIFFPKFQFEMVRLGIGMYGYVVDKLIQKKLKNVITLKTKISQIIFLKKGESVGYNRKFFAQKNTHIATLPIGYADGIFRKLGNGNFQVLIGTKKAKIVGVVCMDMIMVELGDFFCNEGDEVIIYGEQNSVAEAAKKCDTNPYEILTSISNRVKRVFVND